MKELLHASPAQSLCGMTKHSGLAVTLCPGVQTEAVHFLLKWGADCKLKDHDGVSPIDTARHFPEILAAMHQQQVLATSYTLCSGYRLYITLVSCICLPLFTRHVAYVQLLKVEVANTILCSEVPLSG